MKKNVFLLLPLILISVCCYCQENADTMKFEYSAVVVVDSSTASALQSQARIFVNQNFTSGKSVIQMDDTISHTIIGNGNFDVHVKALGGTYAGGHVDFQFKLEFRNGKFRYTFSRFEHSGDLSYKYSGGLLTSEKPACGTFNMIKKQWREIKMETDSKTKHLIDGLTVFLKNHPAADTF